MTTHTDPGVGDIVLFTMPKDWHPELGVREYPAIVVAVPGPGGLDVQVFTGSYGTPAYCWTYADGAPDGEADARGSWRPRPVR